MVIGDFNRRSSQLWENDIDNDERKAYEPSTPELWPNQLNTKPIHFMGKSLCVTIICSRIKNPKMILYAVITRQAPKRDLANKLQYDISPASYKKPL